MAICRWGRSLGLLGLMSLGVLLIGPAHAGEAHVACECPDGISVKGEPWVRMVPAMAPVTSAYVTLSNSTDRDIQIIASSSPVGQMTELHGHLEDEDGVMRMREVESITIPAKGQVRLEPGGLHIMMFDLVGQLTEGGKVPVRLQLEGMSDIKFHAEVQRAEVRASGGGHHHHH